jgi:hypothetical protein
MAYVPPRVFERSLQRVAFHLFECRRTTAPLPAGETPADAGSQSRSSDSTTGPLDISTACSMTLRSSRTLPGQRCCSSARRASADSVRPSLP